jgi:hypothetical protein
MELTEWQKAFCLDALAAACAESADSRGGAARRRAVEWLRLERSAFTARLEAFRRVERGIADDFPLRAHSLYSCAG